MAGQMGTKDIINTSAPEKCRVKGVSLPDETDPLIHWAVFIAIKAKTNTTQVAVPGL